MIGGNRQWAIGNSVSKKCTLPIALLLLTLHPEKNRLYVEEISRV
jgi:hypothetical protein